jgi:hypothetical protein
MRLQLTAAAALLSTMTLAHAQQDIEWKQIINVPKGTYMPRGSGDILGIELGDSYADAKKKLQALQAEALPVPTGSQESLKEERKVFRMGVPGASTVVAAVFVSKLALQRRLKGSTASSTEETIEVYLSAPSSGQQVVAVQRFIGYSAEADQPRVSELLGQLKSKMGADPQSFPSSSGTVLRYQYDEARPFVPAKPSPITCQTSLHVLDDANQLQNVNQSGNCDALLEVSINFGLSRDHAKSMTFTLSDNERLKANLTADYRYVSLYVRDLQERTRGAPPKL